MIVKMKYKGPDYIGGFVPKKIYFVRLTNVIVDSFEVIKASNSRDENQYRFYDDNNEMYQEWIPLEIITGEED